MSARDTASSVGPFLILFLGLSFTIVMLFYVFAQFRYILGGVSVQAMVTRSSDLSETVEVTFTDEVGDVHTQKVTPANKVEVGETIRLRYLTSDPRQARLEEDLGITWGFLWVLLGLGVTGVGVLLVWGRHPGRWRPGRPGER